MANLQMWVVMAIALLLLAETAHHVQARPGPPAFYAEETLKLSRHFLSAEQHVGSEPESVNLSNRDGEVLDFEEELDAVCLENGSCDVKRFLIDSVDYRHDGPNNPITDPPPHP